MDETEHAARPASRERIALWGMILIYVAVYSVACVVKWRNFLYDDIDLAIFAQAESGLLRGSLVSSIRGGAWLGDHASLNLFLIAPIYAVFHYPLALPIVQTVVLALGAIAVVRLARREGLTGGVALVLAAVYLLNPAVGHTNLFEFHPEVLSTTALLFAFVELRADRLGRCALWTTLALLGKEDVALVVAAMGLYAFTIVRPSRVRFSTALLGLAAGFLALNFAVLKPLFAHGGGDYALMYREWGASLTEIARNVVTHPLKALGALWGTPGDAFDTLLKRGYYLELLLPLAFLPILSPLALLIPLPIVAEHFLSWRYPQHAILNQYTALVTPFVIAAAVLGVARFAGRGRTPAMLASLALIGAVFGQMVLGPFRPSPRYWGERVVPSAADVALSAERERMLARVPDHGGILAGSDVLVRFAARDSVHALNHLLSGTYTFSLRPFAVPEGVTAVLANVGRRGDWTLVNDGTSARWRELMRRNGLVPAAVAGDVLLMLRAPADTVALVSFEDTAPESAASVSFDAGITFRGARLGSASVAPGALLDVDTWWQRSGLSGASVMTQLVIVNDAGETVDDRVRFLGYTIDPPGGWPEGAIARERYRLVLPEGIPAGRYGLGMRVWLWREKPELAATADAAVRAAGGFIRLGEFAVGK